MWRASASGMNFAYSVPCPPSAVKSGPQKINSVPSFSPVPKFRPQLEHVIEAIADASNGCDAAIQVGLERAFGRLGVVLRAVFRKSRRSRPRWTWTSIKPGSTVLPAASLFRIQASGVRRGAGKNLRNLALPDEDGAGFDDPAVADENARILNQPVSSAFEFPREDLGFRLVLPAPRLVSPEEKNGSKTTRTQNFCRRPQLLLFFQRKILVAIRARPAAATKRARRSANSGRRFADAEECRRCRSPDSWPG